MRLIDADALNEKLCKTTIFIKGGEIFQRMINDAPTIDAVEVVRCKDCKHRDPEDKKCDCGMWHFPYITDDNDYCSYGERREP